MVKQFLSVCSYDLLLVSFWVFSPCFGNFFLWNKKNVISCYRVNPRTPKYGLVLLAFSNGYCFDSDIGMTLDRLFEDWANIIPSTCCTSRVLLGMIAFSSAQILFIILLFFCAASGKLQDYNFQEGNVSRKYTPTTNLVPFSGFCFSVIVLCRNMLSWNIDVIT